MSQYRTHPADVPGTRVRRLALAVLAAVTAVTALGVQPAAAGTTPVFLPGPAPDDWSGPMGMSHAISVSGNYVPLAMGCGDPEPERRILWYAPGTATDSLWTNLVLPDTGPPTHGSTTVRVDGTFQPFVGDFDGDACDDIFWYAPGTGTDVIWYFNTDGTHTSVPVRVDGTFTPVVGNWVPTTVADEILWYAPGTAADRWWSFGLGRDLPTSVAGTQISGTYRPIRGIDRSTIIWASNSGSGSSIWTRVTSSTAPATAPIALPPITGFQTASIGGEAVVRQISSGEYSLTLGVRPVSGGTDLAPTGASSTLPGAPSSPVMTDSTYRAGFGVLHGPGAAPDLILEPRRTANGSVTSLDAGILSPCAVQSRIVKCWGATGATGIAAQGFGPLSSHVPIAVKGITTATAVAAGNDFACALLSDTTVKCWGNDSAGQRGNGAVVDATNSAPTTVSGLTGVVQITAGLQFACARLDTGEVRCWGTENDGELGNGGALSSVATTPVAVVRTLADGVGTLTAISSIDAGPRHVCAITTSGAARCWGQDTYEQLGNGTGATSSSRPVAVSLLSDVREISAGATHTCARIGTGGVRCWGTDEKGETGDGGTIVPGARVALPSVVVGISDASSISAGIGTSCARLATTGQLRCWGDNQTGAIGDGTLVNRSSPAVVRRADGTPLTAQSVSAGALLNCARSATSTVQCWGYNVYGATGSAYARIADGTPRTVPNLDGTTFTIVPVP